MGARMEFLFECLTRHVATGWPNACITRARNNVARCWVEMLCAFGRAF